MGSFEERQKEREQDAIILYSQKWKKFVKAYSSEAMIDIKKGKRVNDEYEQLKDFSSF